MAYQQLLGSITAATSRHLFFSLPSAPSSGLKVSFGRQL
jgi:hypothetical protein